MQLKSRLFAAEIVLSLIGIAISIYLTASHYFGFNVACPLIGPLDCATLLNSQYASLAGVPLSVFGIVFFVIMLSLIALRKKTAKALFASTGLGFVFYFLYLEYLLGRICPYCTAVHIIVVSLLATSIYEMWDENKKEK